MASIYHSGRDLRPQHGRNTNTKTKTDKTRCMDTPSHGRTVPRDTKFGYSSSAAGLVSDVIGGYAPRRVNPVPGINCALATPSLDKMYSMIR